MIEFLSGIDLLTVGISLVYLLYSYLFLLVALLDFFSKRARDHYCVVADIYFFGLLTLRLIYF